MNKIIATVLMMFLAIELNAASIWKAAQVNKQLELFSSEEKVWKRHDLVRVMIIEKTTAMHDDETDLKKDSSFASKVTAWFKWDFGLSKPIQARTLPSIGYQLNKNFKTES